MTRFMHQSSIEDSTIALSSFHVIVKCAYTSCNSYRHRY
uniref:Uncharacterized protein n=1 Tax=Lepeophtheirus salmonis TaxID=72036 RepID=A0A0K2TZQ5_LEPSM